MPPFSTLPIISTNLVYIIQHLYHVCQAGFVQGRGMGADMVRHLGWQELGVWGNHRRLGNALPVLGIHEVAMEGELAVLQTSLWNIGNTIGSQLGKLDKTQAKRSSCMPPNTKMRRRPTLPPRYQGSTIGAGGLNFRVRNGNGCFPSAIATAKRPITKLFSFTAKLELTCHPFQRGLRGKGFSPGQHGC